MSNKCQSCGDCCRLFYINLSKSEFLSGQYQLMDLDSRVKILAKQADGSCLYLVNNLCSIHTTRPKVCRHFFCSSKSKRFSAMRDLIKKL